MGKAEDLYNSLISIKTLVGLTADGSLELIGDLVDLSFEMKKVEGLRHAIRLSEELQKMNLSPTQMAIFHYFTANAWASIKTLLREGRDVSWDWEQEEAEKEILHLRKAMRANSLGELPDARTCQILTNLGNALDYVGRFVEAIEYWDRALDLIPSFAMARGNRGFALVCYAGALYDKGQASVLLKHAHSDLTQALSLPLRNGPRTDFEEHRAWIESVVSKEFLNKDIDMSTFSLGTSEEEIRYRNWCLKQRLFLNPLNDLGPYPVSAHDCLTTPPIVVRIGEGPYYPGFFNQIKQEYVSARYLYYKGISHKVPHFSDLGVLLYNTLDSPSYSLAVEEVKAGFRFAYSLFDKIAYFLNHYLILSIPKRDVTFRTFWYESQKRKCGLRPDLNQLRNWPLHGLFWLSKDLYENKPGFKEALEPDAQDLSQIRNNLEHKYLKLHDNLWEGPHSDNANGNLRFIDTLALSIYRNDFQTKALRLIKMARAALVYLSLSIHSEEKRRAKETSPDIVISEMPLDLFNDECKI